MLPKLYSDLRGNGSRPDLTESKKKLGCAHAAKKELRQQEEALEAGEHDRQENPEAPNVNMIDYDACRRKWFFIGKKTEGKDHALIDPQTRFDKMEKEYQLRYKQTQEQHKN